MLIFLSFLGLVRSEDWPTPSPSWNVPDYPPEWPTQSPEWPPEQYPKPDWPTPTEKWPDTPIYPPTPSKHLTAFQIAMIVVGSTAGLAIIVIAVILIIRKRPHKKSPEYHNPNFSTPTDSLLQNTDEL
ncbi:hypothetical protein TVAG_456500 [Trichomonas vaginalis G3]|uniref:Uncharacterized protein n=1 Tax=Trichomonas vaginalis (strain ATCC PRA-98 / G3) TaxID=412133 RepID=A2DBX4_TRIV3|nr:hypothetical protein TVAGG3_0264330 [Trichomonas vaginalis G3]EAY22015.1 hypothetical protein TVAG_456500 [Trichomonas vaginalis G3]KAI5525360.1 hypothetical protein TVAGG3_0264330 [Trichomonas vaginalis G3]|eukprot:XP_001583001.1 hypothetical protein [Trichomonas vaginalis G3]